MSNIGSIGFLEEEDEEEEFTIWNPPLRVH